MNAETSTSDFREFWMGLSRSSRRVRTAQDGSGHHQNSRLYEKNWPRASRYFGRNLSNYDISEHRNEVNTFSGGLDALRGLYRQSGQFRMRSPLRMLKWTLAGMQDPTRPCTDTRSIIFVTYDSTSNQINNRTCFGIVSLSRVCPDLS